MRSFISPAPLLFLPVGGPLFLTARVPKKILKCKSVSREINFSSQVWPPGAARNSWCCAILKRRKRENKKGERKREKKEEEGRKEEANTIFITIVPSPLFHPVIGISKKKIILRIHGNFILEFYIGIFYGNFIWELML